MATSPKIKSDPKREMNASDMKGVTYGCSMKKVKHEDAHLLKLGTDSALFGVFDGHGGDGISFACAERLAPLVGKARNTDEVEDAFWHFDATIGPKVGFPRRWGTGRGLMRSC